MDHISDTDLERFYLGMISEGPELATLEVHLLVCAECVERAETSDAYVDAIRAALVQYHEKKHYMPLSDLNGCSQARKMLNCYRAALAAFRTSQKVLLTGMLPDDPRYQEALRLKERAFAILLRARKVYRDHVYEHKCRRRTGNTWNSC